MLRTYIFAKDTSLFSGIHVVQKIAGNLILLFADILEASQQSFSRIKAAADATIASFFSTTTPKMHLELELYYFIFPTVLQI